MRAAIVFSSSILTTEVQESAKRLDQFASVIESVVSERVRERVGWDGGSNVCLR